VQQTKISFKLIDATEPLYAKILQDTGITPESVNYETHTRQIGLLRLDGLDIKKEYEKMMVGWGPISKLA